MRCKFCGSTSIHTDKQRKNFSSGKAVAGAITFGVVGTAAGFIGKDVNGYRCGACGSFSQTTMDAFTEMQVNEAIRSAERGNTRLYNYYKNQYPNIQANIPTQEAKTATEEYSNPEESPSIDNQETDYYDNVKRIMRYNKKKLSCPLLIEEIIIKNDGNDTLSLRARNTSNKTIRSVYLSVETFDDTGDKIDNITCVYQGTVIPKGDYLPLTKEFDLETNLCYKANVTIDKIAFTDDEVWRNEINEKELDIPSLSELEEDEFPRFKYISYMLVNNMPSPAYLPSKQHDFWQCICGLPVLNEEKCPCCEMSYDEIMNALNQENLLAKQQEEIKKTAAVRAEKSLELYRKAVDVNNETIYKQAIEAYAKQSSSSMKEALSLFEQVSDYKDSSDYINKLPAEIKEAENKEEQNRIDRQKREEEKAKKKAEEESAIKALKEKEEAEKKAKQKRNRIIALCTVGVIAIGIFLVILFTSIIPGSKYDDAKKLMNAGKYEEAYAAFSELGNFKDSESLCLDIKYKEAKELVSNGNYKNALDMKDELSSNDYEELRSSIEYEAKSLSKDDKYDKARNIYLLLGDQEQAEEQLFELAKYYYQNRKYVKGKKIFQKLDSSLLDVSDKEINKFINACDLNTSIMEIKKGKVSKGKKVLTKLITAEDWSEYSSGDFRCYITFKKNGTISQLPKKEYHGLKWYINSKGFLIIKGYKDIVDNKLEDFKWTLYSDYDDGTLCIDDGYDFTSIERL